MSAPPALPGVEHRFVEANGVRLHVADTGGDKPPVVLLHGWPQHWWEWRDVIPLLAPHRRVIAPDLRGFGWSSQPPDGSFRKDDLAADVIALLDALGLEQVDVVGHDWGGYVAFLLALDHPDRIRRLVISNTGHPLGGRDPRVAMELWRFWYQLAIAGGLALRRRVLTWLALDAWDAAEREMFLGPLATPEGRRTSTGMYRTFVLHELPPLLAGARDGQRLRQPTLWLHGEGDRLLRRPLVESLRPRADDLEIQWVPGVGHFLVDERPELVAERALAFLG